MSAATPPALSLRDLALPAAEAAPALAPLSLDLAQGDSLALLGPGGTSVLAAIAGFLPPSGGHIRIRAAALRATPPRARPVALVPAFPDLPPHLPLATAIATHLTLRGLPRRDARARAAATLDRLGLTPHAAATPPALSPTLRTLALFARALAQDPALLLCDAPLAALPEHARHTVLDRLAALPNLPARLVATNDPAEALASAARIGILTHGHLAQLAPPDILLDDPISAEVATALGETNLLPGQVEEVDDTDALIRLAGGPIMPARMADPLRPGQPCRLAIRPERIALAATEAASLGDAATPAVVRDIRHLGSQLRIRLAIGPNLELTVLRPASTGYAHLTPNRPAAFAWQPSHARAFATPG